MRWRWIGVAFALLVASAGVAQRSERAEEDQRLGSLLALVPRGPSWVVRAWPRVLAKQPAALALWRAAVPENLEQAFQKRTGVAPLQVAEAVGCKLPANGWLIMARGPFDADAVVEHAGERLAQLDVRVDRPFKRREGIADGSRYTYVALSAYSVLVAKDAPAAWLGQLFARRDAVLARQATPKNPGMLEAVPSLLSGHAAEPLVVFMPNPLQFPARSEGAQLFARERALAISVLPTSTDIEATIDLRGEFQPGVEGKLRAFTRGLATEPIGRLVDFPRAADRMSIRVGDQAATLAYSFAARDLVAIVRKMSFTELRTTLGL